MQVNFSELPEDGHESLRCSMMEHLKHINEHTHTGIATQISVAFADLVLLMAGWPDPIGEYCFSFG